MSEKLKTIKNSIELAKNTESIVKTMKAFSSAKIEEFSLSKTSLEEYEEIIALNFTVANLHGIVPTFIHSKEEITDAIIFGSDHGMVGRFNEALVAYTKDYLSKNDHVNITVVGKLLAHQFSDEKMQRVHACPLTQAQVPRLIGNLFDEIQRRHEETQNYQLAIFYNTLSQKGLFRSTHRILIPLSHAIFSKSIHKDWKSKQIPEIIHEDSASYFRKVVQEFLYISLLHICVSSLLAEHKIRMTAMQEAEKNIGELLKQKNKKYHQIRKDLIDQELFDLIGGYHAIEDQDEP